MKGLRKVLTPFAPDQSGAVSVLYELGGLIVVCDAGGCTGNICGFDEPRWTLGMDKKQSHAAIFSAGLRDMDAIMGRDKMLVEKLVKAVNALGSPFAAIVGTPVPACIGTDYQALARMAEKKAGIPVLALDTSGMQLSDRGASKAYLQLMKKFCRFGQEDKEKSISGQKAESRIIGVLGANPLDLGSEENVSYIEDFCLNKGFEQADQVWFYGLRNLGHIKNAAIVSENLVVAPSGIAAAKYLKETFGTPYRIDNPAVERILEKVEEKHRTDRKQKEDPEREYMKGLNVLVVSQFVTADSLRRRLLVRGARRVTAATWFMMPPELAVEGDALLSEEDQFTELVRENNYDMIIADSCLRALVPFYGNEWIDLPEFAVSGRTK